jgi:hypothetical protein
MQNRPRSSEELFHRLAVAQSVNPDGRRYVPSPSGVRTRLSELVAVELAEVVDSDGRTAAGNRCHRYAIASAGRAIMVAAQESSDVDAHAAALIDARWTEYQATLAAPAHLIAEVVPVGRGTRVEVRLVRPDGVEVVGYLCAWSPGDLALVAALINGEPT